MKLFIYLVICVLFTACSDTQPEDTAQITGESGDIVLQVTDSIGVETGDENLVFGSIESMCYTPDGNIALLDRAFSEVRIFTPGGEFIRTIGGQGSGPGELNMTIYMGISQGGNLFVSQRSGCNEFNYQTGEWITMESFNGPPPISITGGPDSCFLAISMEMVETDEGLGIDASVSRFTDCYTKDVAYDETFFDLNPMDMSSFFQQGWYGYCFDTDRDGNVFIARASEEEYLITGYTPEGEAFLFIEKQVEPVLKTEEEILEEKWFYEARFESLGMGQMGYTPLQNWTTVRSIGVDGQNRVWVLRGAEAVPTFDVFDSAGSELFTAILPYAGEEGRYWRFTVEPEGILAWSDNPESGWQKYYMITIPE